MSGAKKSSFRQMKFMLG